MRLASSGPFHNLVVFGWLWVLAFSGSGDLLWTDMGDMGRVVDSVAAVSQLDSTRMMQLKVRHLRWRTISLLDAW
jgi:hypothetical protein